MADREEGPAAVRIADTSPYMYTATFFFTLSALSSDLLFIRFSLMNGFLFLVLAAWSRFSKDGSFDTSNMPFVDGTIDIPLIVNTVLFFLNFVVVVRLVDDERPKGKLTAEEQALYRFFHCRCGLTRLEFGEILRHGRFLELGANKEVPLLDSTLYLVCEGVVECHATFHEDDPIPSPPFYKRSGQLFDIKLFNVFTLPVGFDSFRFQAKTICRTRLFGWTVHGLVAMRDTVSPNLKPYWEYMVLRSLTASAVRHHLRDTDTLYDAWLVPEDDDWLEGAPSRDFGKPPSVEEGTCSHLGRVLQQIYDSLWHVIPPRGVRHGRPSMVVKRNPKQDCIELMAKAKQDCVDLLVEAKATSKDFRFLSSDTQPQPPQVSPVREVESEINNNNNNNDIEANATKEAGNPGETENRNSDKPKEDLPGEAADRFLRERSSGATEEAPALSKAQEDSKPND